MISILKKYKNLIRLTIPFLLMDGVIRVLSIGVNYLRFSGVVASILFSAVWITLFIGVSINLKKNSGRIVYAVLFTVFYILFVTNCIYFLYTDFFFGFSLLQMAGHGRAYMGQVILNTNPIMIVVLLLVLATGIYAIIKFNGKEKSEFKYIGILCIAFIVLHCLIPLCMGVYSDNLKWDNWRSPRNVYENYNDSNKSIKVSGFYEYSIRDFYMTFLKAEEKENEEDLQFLNAAYGDAKVHKENEYTGLFEGKNIIFLQLEGLDSWLLNKEDTPNLYGLLENSIVFDNHYSYYNGGGSTFNSELAVNTGFITPVSYNQNAYTFSSNVFKYSLPRVLKEDGYSINAFHMNTGEYYSRRLNYLNWGYDNYYGLIDETSYNDASYELDRELVLNESFNEKLFETKAPFMHYIITYTPHTPFNLDGDMGQLLADEYDIADDNLTEEECARLFASETDYMVELLMEGLEENGLLDDTIIVAFSDHYLYTLNDKTILEQYKETENNLINRTPFFIWSKDSQKLVINKANSQIDILPTVLNLLGVEYYDEYYIGRDILDDEYMGYAFFSDYSWYDGSVYAENGNVVNGASYDENYVEKQNTKINELIKKNDLTLKYDFFRRWEE